MDFKVLGRTKRVPHGSAWVWHGYFIFIEEEPLAASVSFPPKETRVTSC